MQINGLNDPDNYLLEMADYEDRQASLQTDIDRFHIPVLEWVRVEYDLLLPSEYVRVGEEWIYQDPKKT